VDPDVTQLVTFVSWWYWRLILPAGTILAGIMIAYGGILYSTSSGEPTKVGRGKEFIFGAITGLVLLLTAALIIKAITT